MEKLYTGLSLSYDLTYCLQKLSNYKTVEKELKAVITARKKLK